MDAFARENISEDEDLRPFPARDSEFTSSLQELTIGQVTFEPRLIPDVAVFLAQFFPATKVRYMGYANGEQIQQIRSLREQRLRDMADWNLETRSGWRSLLEVI